MLYYVLFVLFIYIFLALKENMEFAQLSFTQARKAEVDSQVRVLELEASLAAERKRLAEIRRFNYSNSAEVEMVNCSCYDVLPTQIN